MVHTDFSRRAGKPIIDLILIREQGIWRNRHIPYSTGMRGNNSMSGDASQGRTADSRHADISSICIAVAAHKPYQMPKDPVYMPLHVGKALHPDVVLGFQTDDTGENISELNASYSELTGLYWLWKNCDDDYKGLVHYRRYLASPDLRKRHAKNRFDRIASGSEIAELLKSTDIILPRKRNYYIETIYSHYAHTFDARQFDETRKILLDFCAEYVPTFDRVMASKQAHIFNMFVMSRKRFDEYCAWMFPIINELVKRIPPESYDAFGARYPGRVSERLLDVWLITNEYGFKELPVVSPEPVDWWKKGTGFLMAKFAGKKYTKSF